MIRMLDTKSNPCRVNSVLMFMTFLRRVQAPYTSANTLEINPSSVFIFTNVWPTELQSAKENN